MRRLFQSFSTIGLLCVFCLGLASTVLLRSSFDQLGQLWQNPFRTATRITPSGPVVLEAVQRLNRLETCRYNGQVLVRGDSSGPLPTWLVGDKILFIGRGEVVAGIDLSQLKTEDVQVDDSGVSLRLPSPEILSTHLDSRQSEVYERQTGFFSQPSKDLETKVRIEAEDQIREAALASKVLHTAGINAQEALRTQLTQLGFKQIRFL